MTTSPTPALELRGIHSGYAELTVLRDVDLVVPKGTIVALLGPNGAGKTTLLRTASGLIRPSQGSIVVNGEDVTKLPPFKRAKKGVCLIPEGRGIFRALTVKENLRLQIPKGSKETTDQVLDLFPVLRDRLSQVAGTMSGGQQQMVALARSYLSNPDVVLLDEVSMGLAPNLVDEIFLTLRHLASTGVSMLLVEQYVSRAIEMADEVVLLDRGTVSFAGPASELDENAVLRGYLGVDGGVNGTPEPLKETVA